MEALGLKTLFSSFMGKVTKLSTRALFRLAHMDAFQASKKQKTNIGHAASEDTSHTLGIVSSLLSNLASESPARIRLLTKFVENSYEKAEKLLEIRDSAQARLKATEKEIEDEKKVTVFLSFRCEPV